MAIVAARLQGELALWQAPNGVAARQRARPRGAAPRRLRLDGIAIPRAERRARLGEPLLDLPPGDLAAGLRELVERRRERRPHLSRPLAEAGAASRGGTRRALR